ncbi:MAG: FAD-dependent oxidoreductase, partial [Clostridia bacterium]|nr:FAD-dependent oxidoreductase [Clostridia bacterium]
VMPGCFITGQAAGAAAALVCEAEDVRKIDIPKLQAALKKLGAYLPNAK